LQSTARHRIIHSRPLPATEDALRGERCGKWIGVENIVAWVFASRDSGCLFNRLSRPPNARPFGSTNKGHTTTTAIFFCSVGVLWYAVGRILDSGLTRFNRKSRSIVVFSLLGLLVSLLGIFLSWKAIGMHYFIPPIGGFLWSITVGVLSLRTFAAQYYSHLEF
jgi:hypothetical protein